MKPPRLPPRPPRSPPVFRSALPPGATSGALRFPDRATGLSTAFVGGSGSLSESYSGSLPSQVNQYVRHNTICAALKPTKELIGVLFGQQLAGRSRKFGLKRLQGSENFSPST